MGFELMQVHDELPRAKHLRHRGCALAIGDATPRPIGYPNGCSEFLTLKIFPELYIDDWKRSYIYFWFISALARTARSFLGLLSPM